MIETAKAFAAYGLASVVVLAASEAQVAVSSSDPIVVIGSLAGGVLALLTLVVKDRISSPAQGVISSKDLMDRLEMLANGTDQDREDRLRWQAQMLNRLDSLDDRMKSVEIGQESLRLNVEILADESTVASWRSNQQGHCVWASRALQDMVGYSFREGFEGTNWVEIFPVDEVDHARKRWADSVETGTNYAMRTRYKHKDGTVFPVQLNASVLADGTWRGTAKRI